MAIDMRQEEGPVAKPKPVWANWIAVAACVLIVLRSITTLRSSELIQIAIVFAFASVVGLVARRIPGVSRFWGIAFLIAWLVGIFLI